MNRLIRMAEAKAENLIFFEIDPHFRQHMRWFAGRTSQPCQNVNSFERTKGKLTLSSLRNRLVIPFPTNNNHF